jgi:hypothetical protein
MDDVVWQLETERRDPPPVSPAPGILLKKVSPPLLGIGESENKLAPLPVQVLPPLIMREPLVQEPPVQGLPPVVPEPVQESSLVERPLEGPVVKPPAEAPAKESPPVQEEPPPVTGHGENRWSKTITCESWPPPEQRWCKVCSRFSHPYKSRRRPKNNLCTSRRQWSHHRQFKNKEPRRLSNPLKSRCDRHRRKRYRRLNNPCKSRRRRRSSHKFKNQSKRRRLRLLHQHRRHTLLRRPHLMSHGMTNQAAMNLEGGGRARAAGSSCT